MAKIIQGNRVGKSGKLSVSSSAIIFDEARKKVLLTRRADNARWCIPGGRVDPGESVAEACIREIEEETGLKGEVTKLIGVYSNPHQILAYPDGNRWQVIAFTFEVKVVGGTLGLSDETTEVAYFSPEDIDKIDIMEDSVQRIKDALVDQEKTFIR